MYGPQKGSSPKFFAWNGHFSDLSYDQLSNISIRYSKTLINVSNYLLFKVWTRWFFAYILLRPTTLTLLANSSLTAGNSSWNYYDSDMQKCATMYNVTNQIIFVKIRFHQRNVMTVKNTENNLRCLLVISAFTGHNTSIVYCAA